jgi:hypothetical protein
MMNILVTKISVQQEINQMTITITQEPSMSDPDTASNPYRTPATTSSTDPLSAPYSGQARMQLVIDGGLADARVYVDPNAVALIRVDPCGPAPRVRVDGDTVQLKWPFTFAGWASRMVSGNARSAPQIALHPSVEWSLVLRGGLSAVRLELAAGHVAGIEIRGGCSDVDVDLPAVSRTTSIRIAGGASEVHVRRPSGIGVSVAIDGGASKFRLDDHAFGATGDAVFVHGRGIPDAPRYDVAVSGGASELVIDDGGAAC